MPPIIGFAKTVSSTLAYIAIVGENAVQVYTLDAVSKKLPLSQLPHYRTASELPVAAFACTSARKTATW